MTDDPFPVRNAHPIDLPALPPLVQTLCERVNRPECTPQEIEVLIQRDGALAGRLLKAVNSPLFGLPRQVTSIHRALTLLGPRSVRSLVLCLSLPPLPGRGFSEAQVRDYWTAAAAGAVVARELAVKLRRPDPEDDLAAGLLRDLGSVVLQQAHPQVYPLVLAHPPEVLIANQCWLEEQLLGTTHAEMSALVLRRWGLPDDVVEAVRHHHQPCHAADGVAAERACRLRLAGQLAQLQLTPDQADLGRDIVKAAGEHFGMNEQELGDFLEPLAGRVHSLAGLLTVEIRRCEEFPALLARSIDALVRRTESVCRDGIADEEEVNEAEQDVVRWRRSALRLRREALRDPATDIYTRGFFEETLALEFRRAARASATLGLLFVRLDEFQAGAERHGALFADQFARAVVRKVRREMRGNELLARHGEDAFCALVPETSAPGMRALAARLGQAVSCLTLRHEGTPVPVRARVAALVCDPGRSGLSPEQFLEAARKALDHVAGDASLVEEIRCAERSVAIPGEPGASATGGSGRALPPVADAPGSPVSFSGR